MEQTQTYTLDVLGFSWTYAPETRSWVLNSSKVAVFQSAGGWCFFDGNPDASKQQQGGYRSGAYPTAWEAMCGYAKRMRGANAQVSEVENGNGQERTAAIHQSFEAPQAASDGRAAGTGYGHAAKVMAAVQGKQRAAS
jgi:hypothetical protein